MLMVLSIVWVELAEHVEYVILLDTILIDYVVANACKLIFNLQVIIEYLEDSPDASYEDLLNKIEVSIKLNRGCV